MDYRYTLNLVGSLGLFGRFAIAMVILIVLKNINKNDPELDSGLRKLVFGGIAALIILAVLVILWFVLFGAAFTFPLFGHVYH